MEHVLDLLGDLFGGPCVSGLRFFDDETVGILDLSVLVLILVVLGGLFKGEKSNSDSSFLGNLVSGGLLGVGDGLPIL